MTFRTTAGTGVIRCLFAVAVVLTVFAFATPAYAGMELRYAKGLRMEPLDDCVLVTVKPAWKNDSKPFRYLLVPRGKSAPAEHPPAQVIFTPVRNVVSLSTTHLAYIDAARLADRLTGLADFKHVNSPSVRRRIEAGELREVGYFTNLRIEALLELSPDLILTPASGSAYDAHPKLIEAGLPAVLTVDHLEEHPLGRCEWIKFHALLFGTEDHAEALFRDIAVRYEQLVEKASKPEHRPVVLTNTPFGGQWWAARADSYVARLIKDAGGDYLWKDKGGVGSMPLDIETVFDRAMNADIWLNTGVWKSLEDARNADPRFHTIPAFAMKRLFNNNKRLNKWGGNDYWESGILRPDVLLADLVSILQPRLLPGRELVYYRRLE